VHQIPYSKSTICVLCIKSHIQRALRVHQTQESFVQRALRVHQIPYSQSTTCASNPIFKEHYLSIKSHIQTALFVHQIPCSKSIVCASNPIFKEHYLCIKSHIHRALRVHQILYSKCIKSHIQTALFVHQIPYSKSTICASNPIFKEHYLCIKHKGSLSVRTSNTGVVTLIFNSLGFGVW